MDETTAEKLIKLTNDGYNKIANKFSDTRQYSWPIFNEFKNYIKENDNVLDIGCGNGRLAQFLDNVNYLGIDCSEEFIKIAKEKYKNNSNINFERVNVINESFGQDNYYNVVLGIAMFNHVPGREKQLALLNKINKIIKKEGYLILTNWNLFNIKRKKNIYNYLRNRKNIFFQDDFERFAIDTSQLKIRDVITKWQSNKTIGYLYYYAFTIFELKKLLGKSGFKLVKAYYEKDGHKSNILYGDNLVTIAQKLNKNINKVYIIKYIYVR